MVDKEIFELAIKFTLSWEGGYVNDPNDPGGETKYGISKRQYPNLDIKNLTVDQAKQIYYNDYWKKYKIDKIAAINPYLSIITFDTQVNTGKGIKILQKTIKDYPSKEFKQIVLDNKFGPITEKYLINLNHISPNFLIHNYINNRTQYYLIITKRNIKLRKFLYGWLNRTISLRNYILTIQLQHN